MKPELFDKWIAALRSGEYEQGGGVLRANNSFCCLGVLCDVSGEGIWSKGDLNGARHYIVPGGFLFKTVPAKTARNLSRSANNLFLPDETVRTAMRLNDINRAPFAEIADYLEAHRKEIVS